MAVVPELTGTPRAGLPLRVANPHPVEPGYRRLARVAGVLVRLVARLDWGPAGTLPASGGVILVANHISQADPVVVAHYLIWNGRWPRFLAKQELWRMPLVGRVMAGTGQLPVQRGGERAADSLGAAEAALRRGECVVVYPEGTITADPDGWPMTAHPGAARLALATGCPVVPLGQWGAQRLLGGRRISWPRLVPRPVLSLRLGEPVVVSDLDSGDPGTVAELGERIMAALTGLVAGIRGEQPPAGRFDLRLGRRVPGARPEA